MSPEEEPREVPPAEDLTPVADVLDVTDPPERKNQDYPELDERGQWKVPEEEPGE